MVRNSRGFTLIELLLVVAIIGILMSLAMANYHYARLQAAETSAITSLNAINQAQISYMHSCGNQKFAPSLRALGKPSPGTDAAFLSPDLTGADEILKSGYRIAMPGQRRSSRAPRGSGPRAHRPRSPGCVMRWPGAISA